MDVNEMFAICLAMSGVSGKASKAELEFAQFWFVNGAQAATAYLHVAAGLGGNTILPDTFKKLIDEFGEFKKRWDRRAAETN